MKTYLLLLFFFLATAFGYSQIGDVNIKQPNFIKELMAKRKEYNKKTLKDQTFKIQVFSGSKSRTDNVVQSLLLYIEKMKKYKNIKYEIVFDTPNYKIQVGNFITKLEADRWLVKIRKQFPRAFIL